MDHKSLFVFHLSDTGPCSVNGEVLTQASGTVTSNGYNLDGNGSYAHNAKCTWILQAPANTVILKTTNLNSLALKYIYQIDIKFLVFTCLMF